MELPNPHENPHWRLSKCCNAKTATIPACFGDPSFTICAKCNKEAEIILLPVYEKISRGCFRPIEYNLGALK